MMTNRLTFTLFLTGALILLASCGGGGTTIGDVIQPVDTTGSITGILTTDGIETHAASAADSEPVAGAEVWCEDGSGLRRGQDTTGADGSFCIDGLPADAPLKLHFRFMARGGFEDVEGELGLELMPGEQKHIERHIRQHDDDGDGVCERVGNGGEDSGLQIRLRERREQSDLPDLPEELLGAVQDWDSLPLIPFDNEADEYREASAIDGVPFSVLGLEYLRQRHCTDLDDALYIGDDETRFSWAFYEIAGFVDQDIENLTVSCRPDEGSEYYIGVSNFRSRHWEWSEPVTESEYTFMVNTDFRHVSCAGSLYFLVVTAGDNAASMFSAYATPIDVEPWEPPVPPDGMTIITGTVLDDAGEPIRYVHLEISNGERRKHARVHHDGNFRVALPEGTFTITPHHRGYTFEPESAEVVLPSEDEIILNFVGTAIPEE